RRAALTYRPDSPAIVAAGVLGLAVASLVHGMVDSAYFVPDLALVFWWSVGLALLAGRAAAACSPTAGDRIYRICIKCPNLRPSRVSSGGRDESSEGVRDERGRVARRSWPSCCAGRLSGGHARAGGAGA